MHAALSEDQLLLVETAARLAEEIGCPAPTNLPPTDDDIVGWRLLAETGFVGVHVPEARGGGGAHSADVALVVEQLAGQTCVAPYLGQGVLAPELLWRAGSDLALVDPLLASMVDGSQRVTVALDRDLCGIARVGTDAVAWDALGATHALAFDLADRLCLVAIDGDRTTCADITREVRSISSTAHFEELGDPVPADVRVRLTAFALAMVAADLVGVMQSAVDAAAEYVKNREQFGVAVGTFQAVQHLAADAKVLLEGARSSMWFAAWAVDELEAHAALLAAHQAKAYCSRVGREVVELQVQLFGGIAITWEERAHVRVRRVLLDRVSFGDEFVHEDAIARVRLEETV